GGQQSYPSRARRRTEVKDLPLDVPTVGSLGHSNGNCKPCFYMFSKTGCNFGRSCRYCHLDHVKRKKDRPPKLVRQECKEIANQVFQSASEPAESGELEGTLRSRSELSRAGPATTKYAASVLRALGRESGVSGEEEKRVALRVMMSSRSVSLIHKLHAAGPF
ncbi:unnamed protein product, partial [Effrenium voratum]